MATVLAILVIAAVSVSIGIGFESWLWGGLSALVLGLSLHRFFMPSSYTMTEIGLSARMGLLKSNLMNWERVRRIEVTGAHGRAVLLSTRTRPSIMDRFNAVAISLPANGAHAQDIRFTIEERVKFARLAAAESRAPAVEKGIRPASTGKSIALEEPLLTKQMMMNKGRGVRI